MAGERMVAKHCKQITSRPALKLIQGQFFTPSQVLDAWIKEHFCDIDLSGCDLRVTCVW
jgi:hypothetical protein